METVRQQTTQTISLDEAGGAVVLSLTDGEGHAFRQALDAHDTGKLLGLIAIRGPVDERVLCQGDLEAKFVEDCEELHFTWHDENGGDGLVRLDYTGVLVFEAALKSYCRKLMRSQEDLPCAAERP